MAATPPPAGAFDRVEKVGRVWIAWLDGRRWARRARRPIDSTGAASRDGPSSALHAGSPGGITVPAPDPDPGWTVRLDGKPLDVVPGPGPFLTLYSPKGEHQIILQYDPIEVRIGR